MSGSLAQKLVIVTRDVRFINENIQQVTTNDDKSLLAPDSQGAGFKEPEHRPTFVEIETTQPNPTTILHQQTRHEDKEEETEEEETKEEDTKEEETKEDASPQSVCSWR